VRATRFTVTESLLWSLPDEVACDPFWEMIGSLSELMREFLKFGLLFCLLRRWRPHKPALRLERKNNRRKERFENIKNSSYSCKLTNGSYDGSTDIRS
jgi:hypothetical protein